MSSTSAPVHSTTLISSPTIESATTPPPFVASSNLEVVLDNEAHVNPQCEDSLSSVYVKLPRDIYDKVMQLLKERTSRAAQQKKSAQQKSQAPTTRGQSKRSNRLPVSSGRSSSSWSDEEDRSLMSLVKIHGKKDWSIVASELGTARTAKACRDRYHNQLDPQIKRGDWSEDEDNMIIELHETLGNQWTKIAKHMKGRTANTVKNRWHGHLKKLFLNGGAAAIVSKKKTSAQQGKATPQSTSSTQHISITFTASTPTPADENVHPHFQVRHVSSAQKSATNAALHGEAPPFSNDFANNFFGNQEQFFKLDSSGETCSDTSSEFAPSDVAHNIFGLSPSPKKRKRETEEFFVVGKRIKMETPPENLDISTLYADDGCEDFVDPLQFEVSTPVNGHGIKRAPHFDNLMIDVPKSEDEQYQTPAQHQHVYPPAGQMHSGDRSNMSGASHNNTSYDMLSLTISPSNLGAKDLNLWSPKSSSEIFNTSHSPSKHFLRLGSNL